MRRQLLAFATATVAALAAHASRAQSPPPSMPLPDPLITRLETRVTTTDQWRNERKPELRAAFERYMYGWLPARPRVVEGRTLFEDKSAFGGKGRLREIEITFEPATLPPIYLLVASPYAEKPPACFVGANFAGNHLRTDDARVRLPTVWMPANFPGVVDNKATDAGRGKQAEGWDLWPLAEAVERGYAIATFYCGDVQPDRPEVREGLREALRDEVASKGPAGTGAIMMWAWGIERAVDYLVTDPYVDGKRLAIVGHSRLGKAALLAGAFDERIALVIPNQAGCGGSGPSRHNDPKAETVSIITEKFPHWFCQNFNNIGAETAKLPFDQNCLVAMCAPRPVLFSAAAEDLWANPSGQFEVLRAATPVYKLLGVEGLEAEGMPAPGDPLIDSRLGYSLRPGKHALDLVDWQTFFAFADKWLK